MSELVTFILNDADHTPQTLKDSWNSIIKAAHQTGADYVQIRTNDESPRFITAFKIYSQTRMLDDISIIGNWDYDILTANMWEAIKACANDLVMSMSTGVGERTTLINNVTHDVLEDSGPHRVLEVIIKTDYEPPVPQWQLVQLPEDFEVTTF